MIPPRRDRVTIRAITISVLSLMFLLFVAGLYIFSFLQINNFSAANQFNDELMPTCREGCNRYSTNSDNVTKRHVEQLISDWCICYEQGEGASFAFNASLAKAAWSVP